MSYPKDYMPWLKTIGDSLYQTQVIQHHNGLGVHPDIEHMIERDLSRNMADFIYGRRVEKREGEFHTEYRLRLYILTPDQLHSIIQDEVQREIDKQTRYFRVEEPNGPIVP